MMVPSVPSTPAITSKNFTGTLVKRGGLPASLKSNSPCSRSVRAGPGPPMGSTVLARDRSARQPVRYSATSSSLMGLHAVSVPSPNRRNGLPRCTRFTCPERLLKKAVGRTMDQMRPDDFSDASKASFACWNASSGFCTQIADNSTK